MPVEDCYTLAEIAQRTGAKTRAIQAWTDGGVIWSTTPTDRAGRGIHRMYYPWELRIAAILTPLARMGVPIGHLKSFAALIRPLVINAKAPQPSWLGMADDQRTIAKVLGRAIDGVGENYLCYAWGEDFQLITVKTDEAGPACIFPGRDLRNAYQRPHQNANAFVVLDLTNLLRSVTE